MPTDTPPRRLPAKRKASSELLGTGSTDDEIERSGNGSKHEVTQPSCEDGEIAEDIQDDDDNNNKGEDQDGDGDGNDEEGELTAEGERALIDAAVWADVKAGGKDVAQKDARYFMMENVVCGNCGTKGHLSYDCTEQAAKKRCFLCGQEGHASKECPNEVCYVCREKGHRSKECPKRRGGRGVRMKERRGLRPPRPPKLSCYVCGGEGHLDCGLMKLKAGVLSCYNCGMEGHSGAGCHMTSVDRVVPIVMEMERERREKKVKQRGKNVGKRGEQVEDEDTDGSEEKNEENVLKEAKEYREKIEELARKRRYGR